MAQAFDRRRTAFWVLLLAALGAILLVVDTAGASSTGISGYSGNPATNGGASCDQCHSGGATPTVTLDGPTEVAPSETATYTLTIVGGAAGGFNVSATSGVLAAGADSKLSGGEVVQDAVKATAGGEVEWTFDWTAPGTPGSATLYGAGNAVDRDFGLDGDGVATDTLEISVVGANVSPVAHPGGPYTGDPTELITMDGSASFDNDGTIVDWEWDFGDGAPIANGELLFHSYAESGVYTVTLTVTDDLGAEHTATTSATIGEVSNLPPSADAGGPYSGTAGEPIGFDGSGSSDPEGASLSYAWDFGDGNTSDVLSPTHTYATPGTFTATLVVTDDVALSDSDTTTVTVAAAPTTTTTTTTTKAPSGGSAIYAANCASCHGSGGQGGFGPSLQASTMSTSQIRAITTNGAGSMPGYSGSLSSDQISAVASYTKGLQVSGATTTTTEAPSGGGDVYAANCASCHGANGEGGFGPSLQTSTLSTSEINSITTNGSGSMPGYSGSLSSDQISAVSSYAKGLQGGSTSTTLPAGNNELYAAQCAGCHGASGEGGLGPPLRTSTMGLDEIEKIIADGQGTMPGYAAALSAEEISDLAAFTLSLQGVDTTEPPTAVGGEGGELYATHCAACHGTQGEGGIGPALAGTSLSADEMIAAINAGRGVMPGFSAILSAEQIDAVAGFVTSMGDGGGDQPGDPAVSEETEARYAELCAACHGDGGQGTPAGPALTESAMSQDELILIITEGRGAMPGYAGQLSAQEIEDLAVLIGAMQQGPGGSDQPTTTAPPAPPTTNAFGLPPADEGDEDEAPGRTLALVLLAAIVAGGGYLLLAQRRTRSR